VIRQENQGAAAAINAGLRIAGGVYVAFLDQDDLWTSESLAVHIGLLEQHSTIDLTFSWFRIMDGTAPTSVSIHTAIGEQSASGLFSVVS